MLAMVAVARGTSYSVPQRPFAEANNSAEDGDPMPYRRCP